MNDSDKKDIINGIVEQLSNGHFKKDIVRRLDDLNEKIDNHLSHADNMFNRILVKVNEHEKKIRVLTPFVFYFGLAANRKRWVRIAFWVSLFLIIFFFAIIDWKGLGYYGINRVLGTDIVRFIKVH